MKLI
jgi:hypothetical protein